MYTHELEKDWLGLGSKSDLIDNIDQYVHIGYWAFIRPGDC